MQLSAEAKACYEKVLAETLQLGDKYVTVSLRLREHGTRAQIQKVDLLVRGLMSVHQLMMTIYTSAGLNSFVETFTEIHRDYPKAMSEITGSVRRYEYVTSQQLIDLAATYAIGLRLFDEFIAP